jgi:hypothetical protein
MNRVRSVEVDVLDRVRIVGDDVLDRFRHVGTVVEFTKSSVASVAGLFGCAIVWPLFDFNSVLDHASAAVVSSPVLDFASLLQQQQQQH